MLEKFGPKRIIDTPISEAAFSGLGIGAATVGLRPIIEYMSWSFTLVCLDQLVNNAANIRYMSGGQFKVPITFRGGDGIAHQLAATHSHRMESVYARIPGLIVVTPSTPAEAKGLLTSIRCDDPVIFLENEKMLNDKGEVPAGADFTLPLGVANVERPGSDVTLISYGRPLQRVVRPAVEALANDHGIDVELIDVRTLRPLDTQTLLASIKKTHRCVIVDEDWGYCGMGSGILYKIQEPAFDDLDAPIKYVHCDEIPVPYNHYLEEAMMPSVDRIVSAVKEVCYR
jgi:pyruvate dehydrogenase E1 component beta subunit